MKGDQPHGLTGAGMVKDYAVPFVIAFLAFCLAFLALDTAIMSWQGLDLIFRQ